MPANATHDPSQDFLDPDDLAYTRNWLRYAFLGTVPAACTLFAAVWLSWFQLQDPTTAEKIQRFLAQRRDGHAAGRGLEGLYDPITHTPISAYTHAAPSPQGRVGRRRRGLSREVAGTPEAPVESEEPEDDELTEDEEAQKRRATNYMLYFSHADLTLISRYGTAKFLVAFSVQLTLWLIYAGLLVSDAVTLVLKALSDLDNAPEIWADNYTSIGVFDPELNPEQGRLAWSLVIVFVASFFVFITGYHSARAHAAYWLTTAPRRTEFKKIVDERMIEREAEWVGVLAWIAQKNSGRTTILVHLVLSGGVAFLTWGIHSGRWDGNCTQVTD